MRNPPLINDLSGISNGFGSIGSEITVNTLSGNSSSAYGSTYNGVFVFNVLADQVGSSITMLSDSIFGTRFQIREDGMYWAGIHIIGSAQSLQLPQSVAVMKTPLVSNLTSRFVASNWVNQDYANLFCHLQGTGNDGGDRLGIGASGPKFCRKGDIVYPLGATTNIDSGASVSNWFSLKKLW